MTPGTAARTRRRPPRSRSHLFVLKQDLGEGPPEPHRLPGRGADELVRSQHGHGACGERKPREHRSEAPGTSRAPPRQGELREPLLPSRGSPRCPPLPCGGGRAPATGASGASPRARRVPAARAATCRSGGNCAAGRKPRRAAPPLAPPGRAAGRLH